MLWNMVYRLYNRETMLATIIAAKSEVHARVQRLLLILLYVGILIPPTSIQMRAWHHARALRVLIVYLWNYSDLFAIVRSRCGVVLRRMNLQVRAGLLFSKFTFCLGQLTVARSACSRLQHRMASREMLKNVDWCVDLLFDNRGNYICKQLMLHIITHITWWIKLKETIFLN